MTVFRRLVGIALVAGCAGPRATGPTTAGVLGAKRVVTYEFDSSVEGHHVPAWRPTCRQLVLEEVVTRVENGQELELQVQIVGGSDEALCNVGRSVRIVGPATTARAVTIEATPPLDPAIQGRLQYLHGALGTSDGPFSLALVSLPWDAPAATITVGDQILVERSTNESDRFGPEPSEGSSFRQTRMRQRVTDRALVCASTSYTSHGVNFEYGGWSQNLSESIQIDDGQGTASCAPTVE